MSGKAVVKLTFACFLASCYYSPAPIIIITPASPPAGTSGGPGFPPPDDGGPGGTTKQVRGNCLYTRTSVGGSISKKCEYSVDNIFNLCLTNVSECESTPPSGKCSLTQPVATCP
jgi:hypothetical protein